MIAGLLLVSFTLWSIVEMRHGHTIFSFVELLGYVLITLFCFVKAPALLKAGCAIEIVSEVVPFAGLYQFQSVPLFLILRIMAQFFVVLVWIVLFIGSIRQKNAKGLRFISGGIVIARFVFLCISNLYVGVPFSYTSALWHILLAASAFFLCASLTQTDEKTPDSKQGVKQRVSTGETTEKLIKLKALLDDGIITQEEFDAEKKRVLGLR